MNNNDNVYFIREVLLRGGRRVKKVPKFCWKKVLNMVSMELLIALFPSIENNGGNLKIIPAWRTSEWVPDRLV